MSYPTYSTDNGVGCESNTGDVRIGVGDQGLHIEYDILTSAKTFNITPAGIFWTDGITPYTTGLGRLAAVQQAFQAVELPPNSTTLQLNNRAYLNNLPTNNNVIDIDASIPSILVSDGSTSTTITKNNNSFNFFKSDDFNTYDEFVNVPLQ